MSGGEIKEGPVAFSCQRSVSKSKAVEELLRAGKRGLCCLSMLCIAVAFVWEAGTNARADSQKKTQAGPSRIRDKSEAPAHSGHLLIPNASTWNIRVDWQRRPTSLLLPLLLERSSHTSSELGAQGLWAKLPAPPQRWPQAALKSHALGAQTAGQRGDSASVLRPPKWASGASVQASQQHTQLTEATAPIVAARAKEECKCKTQLQVDDAFRVGALYLSRTFSLPLAQWKKLADDSGSGQVLELAARYRSGLRIYLNGELLAERNWPRAGGEKRGAARVRGGEWESFSIPADTKLLRQKGNVLNVELLADANFDLMNFDLQLSLREQGGIVRGPVLQQVGQRQALLIFDTELPSKGRVHFDTELRRVANSSNGELARRHRVWLRGLKPGQAVDYQIEIDGHRGARYSFHTAPLEREPLHFAVYGDMRGGHKVHAAIVQSILKEAIDFVLVTGDLVVRGSDEGDWQRFFEITQELTARKGYYLAAGNHDLGKSGNEKKYVSELFSFWPGPNKRPPWASWHSFDVSGVHFIMLDSNHYKNSEQLDWLEEDLKKAQGARAIFALTHDGPYSRGIHQGNGYAAQHYAPLLRKYGVDLLFAGHDHLYQRGEVQGLPYMVSGGGGAPLYSIRCGGKGQKGCRQKDGMKFVAKEHHYIVVSVMPGYIQACPKRVDSSPLEPCLRYPLKKSPGKSLGRTR